MEKVSIIVPIFNGEKYIDKCLKSLINQTYTNLEIIFINTGSTDNSLNLLKNYQKLDKRIIIIDKKENEGVSVARNLGLKKSTGDFITFADVDDWLELDAIYNMVSLIKKYDVDIVRTSYFYIKKDKKHIGKQPILKGKIKITKDIRNTLINQALKEEFGCYLWVLLIKKELLDKHNIYFDDKTYVHQDLDYYVNLFLNANSIYFSDVKTYNYIINGSGSKNINYCDRNIEAIKRLYTILNKKLNYNYIETTSNLCFSLIVSYLYPLYKKDKILASNKYKELLKDKDFMNIVKNTNYKSVKNNHLNKTAHKLITKKVSFKKFKNNYINKCFLNDLLKHQ